MIQSISRFRVVSEIGPIRDTTLVRSRSRFKPEYLRECATGILCNDRRSQDVIIIDKMNERVGFRLSEHYRQKLARPAACFMVGEQLVVLDEGTQTVIVSSSSGACCRLDVGHVCGNMVTGEPWDQSSFCIVTKGPVAVCRISMNGETLTRTPLPAGLIKHPAGLHITAEKHFVVADAELNEIVEMDSTGRVLWQYSETQRRLGSSYCLLCPSHALKVGAHFYIADTYKNRILGIDPVAGRIIFEYGEDQAQQVMANVLSLPKYLAMSETGHMLICDSGNQRILEVSLEGRAIRSWGGTSVRSWQFSFPRGIAKHNGKFVVADSFRNRVYRFTSGKDLDCVAGDRCQHRLFWPRAVQAGKRIMVGDSRNGRIVEVEGFNLREKLRGYIDGVGRKEFKSIADFKVLRGGKVLIVDCEDGSVVIMDWHGHVKWRFDQLVDPHTAAMMPNGNVLIADTGNLRVIEVNGDGEVVWHCDRLRGLNNGEEFRICPKFAAPFGRNADRVVIVDAWGGMVACARRNSEIEWQVCADTLSGVEDPYLDKPRWFFADSPRTFLISDYDNRRVVIVRRETSRAERLSGLLGANEGAKCQENVATKRGEVQHVSNWAHQNHQRHPAL